MIVHRAEKSAPGGSTICQMARMGDLVQLLPLISGLRHRGPVQLVCDKVVEEWAKLLPDVMKVVAVNTRHWRGACNADQTFHVLLGDLRENLAEIKAVAEGEFYALNDHPVCDLLAANICHARPWNWLNRRVVLLRSYLRLVGTERRWNRIHLSDLWRSLSGNGQRSENPVIPTTPDGTQFAKSALERLYQSGRRRIWAFILGSGGKYRRIAPEIFSAYWDVISQNEDIGLILVGGKGEEELAKSFLRAAQSPPSSVENLVGACTPEELLGLFSAADMVVGVDTGPLHWAAAAGTRVLGLYFGEAGFYDTGPYGDSHLVLAPDCAEYPCHPARALQCDYQCRQFYGNHAELARLMMAVEREADPEPLEVPQGLRLYQSFLSENGNQYRSQGGGSRDTMAEVFAEFVWRVFAGEAKSNLDDDGVCEESCHEDFGMLGSLKGPPYEDQQREAMERLVQRWVEEILGLHLPEAVPRDVAKSVKDEAIAILTIHKNRVFRNRLSDPRVRIQSCASCC